MKGIVHPKIKKYSYSKEKHQKAIVHTICAVFSKFYEALWFVWATGKGPIACLYLFCASRLQARWLPCSRADVVLSSCCLSLAISLSLCRSSRRWLSSSAWHASFSCSSRVTSSRASSRPLVRDSTSTPDSRSSACSSSSCRLADSKVRPNLSSSALRFWLVSSNWSPYEKRVWC